VNVEPVLLIVLRAMAMREDRAGFSAATSTGDIMHTVKFTSLSTIVVLYLTFASSKRPCWCCNNFRELKTVKQAKGLPNSRIIDNMAG
jgi:hypothetical protein